MRKVLFLLVMAAVFVACSKDDDDKEQTFFVQVYSSWDGGNPEIWGEPTEELVKKAAVYLFQNENKSIDTDKSAKSVISEGKITYSDGSLSLSSKYTTNFQSGVFNLENIPNGNYILWVIYMTEYGGRCYSSYKAINVNYDYRGTMEKKVFHTSMSDTGLNIFEEW